MVQHYFLSYNEKPELLASKIQSNSARTSSCSRHSNPSKLEVGEDTVFHLFSSEKLKLNEFLARFGK